MASLDLERLLRDLTSTLGATRDYLAARREDPAQVTHEDPYERTRWTSALSTLKELSPDDPGRPYLASWITWLLLGRTCRVAEVNEALARHAVTVRVLSPTPLELSFRAATERLTGATSEGERSLIGAALSEAASGPADATAELWMRRGEVLRRAGGEALEPLVQPMPSFDALRTAAERVLGSTDELARATLRGGWLGVIALGAGHGDVPWPTRLTPRWLLSPFEGEARWLDVPSLQLGPLPALRGGASVTRALARLGARWADAAAARSLPYPLAHLPTSLARLRTGALLASLLRERVFLTRGLGLSGPEAGRALRQQAAVTLVATRLEAARTLALLALLRGDRRAGREEARERTRHALVSSVPASLALALPRPQPTSPARLLAPLLADADARTLRDRHDEDWYRNPRAVLWLRDRLDRAPALHVTADEVDAALAALHTRLTEALA